MDYSNIISWIEDESIILDNDFYYHAFLYQQEEFLSMINEGIKSHILLGKNVQGNNGYFYVSLSKQEKCEFSIYNRLNHLPMFVISPKIRTIKTENFRRRSSYLSGCMVNLPFPFRQSEYDDEYQKFLKVSSRDILAIQFDIYSYIQHSSIKNRMLILKSMVEDLNSQKICLPIVDSSTLKKINQKKVLSLKI